MKKYTDKEVLEWYEYYKEVRSLSKVAEKFGINCSTVSRRFNGLSLDVHKSIDTDIVKQRIIDVHESNVVIDETSYINLTTKCTFIDKDHGPWQAIPDNVCRGSGHPSRTRKHTYNDIMEWHRYYKKVGSTRKVASKFGVGRPTVKERFRELGLEIKKDARKYFFNEKFFNTNTPESFYWAGFIAADGCITKNRLSLCLAEKDIDHLEKFRKILNHGAKIYIKDHRPVRNSTSAAMSVDSEKLVKSLKRFNIGPRKSLTYSVPDEILKHNLANHFLRGYCDGDGCFMAKNAIGFNIRGTKESLISMREYFAKYCGVNDKVKIPFDSGIYRLTYNGRINVIKIRNFLYKDSYEKIELPRKKKIAFCDMVGSCIDPKNKMPVVSKDFCGNIIKFYNTQEDTKKDGFSPSKVSMCVNGKRKKHKGVLFQKATQEEIEKYK